MLRFGRITFVWTENFSEKDARLITRAKELGFDTKDIGIMASVIFPTREVKGI